MMKHVFTTLGLTALIGLSACATPTPYQPLTSRYSGGYSDLKLSSNRYRVAFEGNSVTDRETVDRYLLYRAADLTVAQGYDWFMLDNRRTDRDTQRYQSLNYMGGWTPTWEYLGHGRWTVVRYYDPFANPYFNTNETTRYRASAEILLGRGPKPANDPAVFDALDVKTNLEPTITLPGQAAT